ncbi:MAG TPA: hypothetical protein VGO40_07515, partial [Longimicrobium sp.]|nr:hypothetical protein [Longimicrobium sp.]
EREVGSGGAPDERLYAWAHWLADISDIDVEIGKSPELDACLVKTRSSAAICMGDHLRLDERTFSLFHELAHLRLAHEANTSYGMDPARLESARMAKFEWQEVEADALAAVYEHVVKLLEALVAPVEIPAIHRPVDAPVRQGSQPEFPRSVPVHRLTGVTGKGDG